MYKLYLGCDPDICDLSSDQDTCKILAKETVKFGTELEARTFAANNDDDMIGHSFYSCWYKNELVFIS